MTAPVPVLVLAGFLGAGKTTLLNRLLANRIGVRVGVIVNDFGAVGIDALLVAGQAEGVVDMGNGCVCCAVDGAELDSVLHLLTTGPRAVDAVVIEASGLAEPRAVIRMVLGADTPTARYGGLIEVVDASAFTGTRRRHPEVETHLRLADLVVLGKTDLVDDAELARLRTVLARLCGPVPVIEAVRGDLDPEVLFDRRAATPEDGPRQMTLDELLAADGDGDEDGDRDGAAHGRRHAHTRYQSVDYSHDGPLHPRRLAALLADPPRGVYRSKGVVALADPEDCGVFEVHTVGGRVHVRRLAAAGRRPRGIDASTPASVLVMIGTGIDVPAVTAALDACRVRDDEPPDPQAMLSVLRYTTD